MARTSSSLHPPERAAATAAIPPGAHRRLTLAAAAILLAAVDTYVVVLALPSIMNDIGIPIAQLQEATPIVSGFLLGYVVVLPLLGRLSDLYGRRPLLIGCLLVFAAGSVLTASAESLAVVVAGRTLQGLGGGGLVAVTLALVADTWPPERRGVPLGIIGAVQEVGSVVGPLYGSVVIALSGWRAIFWINVLAALVLALALVAGRAPLDPAGARDTVPGGGGIHDSRSADVAGAALGLLFAGAALLTLTAPSWLASSDTLGQLYAPVGGGRLAALTTPMALLTWALLLALIAWESAAPARVRPLLPLRRLPPALRRADWPGALLLGVVLGCVIVVFAGADASRQVLVDGAPAWLAAAAVAATAFVVRERRAASPLLEAGAFTRRAAAGGLLSSVLVGAALMAALVDVPIFARATQFHSSQVQAALVLVRFLVAVPLGAILGGLLIQRLACRAVAGGGMLLSAVMFWVMTTWTSTTLADRAVVLGWATPLHGSDLVLALCGLGFGLAIAPVNATVLAAVRPALHGIASSLVVVARTVGMLTGISVLTAIGLHRFYAAQAHIRSPLRLCPTHPATCPAYDQLATAAALDELHAIFVGAAVCAALAALAATVTLDRPAARARRSLGDTLAAAVGQGG